MTNSENERNIYEINYRLFELITFMSESERRELQSAIISNLSEDESRHFLSVLIYSMSEIKRRDLLEKLVTWQHSKAAEMREHPRKPSLISVEYSSDDVDFSDFIQDISKGGVFIQTDGNFHIGHVITLTFSHPKAEKVITVKGKVVRVDTSGIGVQFDEILPGI